MTFTPGSALVWGLGDYDAPALQFNGTDDYGVQWVVDDPDGWDTSTTDVAMTEGADDGGVFSPGRRKPRVMTLRGAYRCADQSQMAAAEDRLRTAVEHYAEDVLLWHRPMPTGESARQMAVRLTGDLSVVKTPRNPRVRTFSAVLTAADPLKYAAGSAGLAVATLSLGGQGTVAGLQFPLRFPLTFGGGVPAGRGALWNPGTRPVYPTVLYTPGGVGVLDTPVLRHLGQGVIEGVGRQLLPYQRCTVNHRMRSVLLDQQSIYSSRLLGTTFFALTPGANDLSFTAAAYQAGATCTVTYRPAWS